MIIHGDSIEILKTLEPNSVDAVVTDPPYGLKFMGKKWDYDVPSVGHWLAIIRVLKPGGHLLSFGGTRTYHRMVVNIEEAGFEIRDQIQWLYGSGFPKSHNIGNGFGTALKPANEPIVLARKPLVKGLTVAQNVERYGTGAINIDGSRIGSEPIKINGGGVFPEGGGCTWKAINVSRTGRFPANLILDESAAEMLDVQFFYDCGGEIGTGPSRFFYVAKASKRERNAGLEGMPEKHVGTYAQDEWSRNNMGNTPDNKRKPVQNFHPTVKPIKLMEYLCRLITPPGGTILDPFMGSGSTGVAAKNLNFKFVGIEMNEEYVEIARKRIEAA